jgi:hypothetical protein
VANPAYSQANDLMNRATRENVIDPRLNAFQKLSMGKANLFKALMLTVQQQRRQQLEQSPWLGQQSSWQLPTTRRYIQSRSPNGGALTQPNPALDWMVEPARFPVPYGEVGIVKSFEQYLSQGQTVHSGSTNWGNPFPASVNVRWYLRLSHVSTVGHPWINIQGLSAIPDYLPGTPYDDLNHLDGLWFPCGSSAAANIHLPIPGGQVLRLIAIVGSSQTAYSIAAKLSGTVQVETNADAQTVVRTTW